MVCHHTDVRASGMQSQEQLSSTKMCKTHVRRQRRLRQKKYVNMCQPSVHYHGVNQSTNQVSN